MTGAPDALVERIFASAVASFDLAGIYLGDRLGWYRSLADDGPATPEELASRTGTDARYAREWLEQQAVGGLLEVDGEHRFSLPDGYRDVLVDPESLSLMAPLSRMVVAAFGQLPQVAEAYRSGAGHGWEAYGRRHARGPGGIQPSRRHAPARQRVAARGRRPRCAPPGGPARAGGRRRLRRGLVDAGDRPGLSAGQGARHRSRRAVDRRRAPPRGRDRDGRRGRVPARRRRRVWTSPPTLR